jgi:glycosyltransferase involved in cell wall biosynthesis
MISDVYFPRVNGVSTSIETFRRQLAALGHETLLIAPAYERSDTAEPGIVRIPSRTVLFDPEDRMMGYRSVLRLEPMLAERRFDLVHIQTPFVAHYAGQALSERLGLPRVETYHTFFEEYLHHYVPFVPKRWMQALARRFSLRQCNGVHAVVVPSQAMAAVLRSYGVRSPIEIVPTGIEAERLAHGDGAQFRRRYGLDPQRPMLAHIGRIAFEKNIDFLLRMLVHVRHRIPDVVLVICGEGPARAHLERLTARLGLAGQVLFVGYLDRRNALLDCYRAADAFVFASRTETQGLVLLEAMAQGIPIVSTAVMGTRDILEPRRGAVVAAEETRDFAAKVIEVLHDAALRERLSREGVAQAAQWAAPRMTERMVELYHRILNRHCRRGGVLGAGPKAATGAACAYDQRPSASGRPAR